MNEFYKFLIRDVVLPMVTDWMRARQDATGELPTEAEVQAYSAKVIERFEKNNADILSRFDAFLERTRPTTPGS